MSVLETIHVQRAFKTLFHQEFHDMIDDADNIWDLQREITQKCIGCLPVQYALAVSGWLEVWGTYVTSHPHQAMHHGSLRYLLTTLGCFESIRPPAVQNTITDTAAMILFAAVAAAADNKLTRLAAPAVALIGTTLQKLQNLYENAARAATADIRPNPGPAFEPIVPIFDGDATINPTPPNPRNSRNAAMAAVTVRDPPNPRATAQGHAGAPRDQTTAAPGRDQAHIGSPEGGAHAQPQRGRGKGGHRPGGQDPGRNSGQGGAGGEGERPRERGEREGRGTAEGGLDLPVLLYEINNGTIWVQPNAGINKRITTLCAACGVFTGKKTKTHNAFNCNNKYRPRRAIFLGHFETDYYEVLQAAGWDLDNLLAALAIWAILSAQWRPWWAAGGQDAHVAIIADDPAAAGAHAPQHAAPNAAGPHQQPGNYLLPTPAHGATGTAGMFDPLIWGGQPPPGYVPLTWGNGNGQLLFNGAMQPVPNNAQHGMLATQLDTSTATTSFVSNEVTSECVNLAGASPSHASPARQPASHVPSAVSALVVHNMLADPTEPSALFVAGPEAPPSGYFNPSSRLSASSMGLNNASQSALIAAAQQPSAKRGRKDSIVLFVNVGTRCKHLFQGHVPISADELRYLPPDIGSTLRSDVMSEVATMIDKKARMHTITTDGRRVSLEMPSDTVQDPNVQFNLISATALLRSGAVIHLSPATLEHEGAGYIRWPDDTMVALIPWDTLWLIPQIP